MFKHLTFLAYVGRAKDSQTPLVLTADPIPDSLWLNGFCPVEDAMIHHCLPAYINESAFFESVTHLVIPYINSRKVNPELTNECTVALMDSASQPVSEQVFKI
jgi:hypothetical protein